MMDQKSLLFQPHILVAPVGATVEFLNSDKVAHNIFWPAISGNKKLGHNLGTWPTGEKRAFKFDTPGVVPLLCNVHPGDVGLHHRDADAVLCGNRRLRKLQDRQCSGRQLHRRRRGTKA